MNKDERRKVIQIKTETVEIAAKILTLDMTTAWDWIDEVGKFAKNHPDAVKELPLTQSILKKLHLTFK